MAVTSNQRPLAADAIEPIELPAVQPLSEAAPARQINKQNETETHFQAVSEPVQQRSTFRTFTVMSALFVSNN